jgi:hypothetical protein
MFFALANQRQQGEVGESQDVGFKTRFFWIEFSMLLFSFKIPLDVFDDFLDGCSG